MPVTGASSCLTPEAQARMQIDEQIAASGRIVRAVRPDEWPVSNVGGAGVRTGSRLLLELVRGTRVDS